MSKQSLTVVKQYRHYFYKKKKAFSSIMYAVGPLFYSRNVAFIYNIHIQFFFLDGKMFICIHHFFSFAFLFFMSHHIFVLCDQNSDTSLQPVVSWYFKWQLATKHTLSKWAQCSKNHIVSITLFLFHRTRPCSSLMRRRFGLQMHQ